MTAEKGYAGPVVVCSVSYEPIAGHRANIPLLKYLSEGREIEIALAPIAGTRLLAPFRLSVVSRLANLMIEPNRFETITAPAPEGTPPTTHPADTSSTPRDAVIKRCITVPNGRRFARRSHSLLRNDAEPPGHSVRKMARRSSAAVLTAKKATARQNQARQSAPSMGNRGPRAREQDTTMKLARLESENTYVKRQRTVR
jgi:hypothetical protein